MSDPANNEKKVHDTYPDETEEERRDSGAHRDGCIIAAFNHARRRPSRVPRPTSASYPSFKAKQDYALKIGVNGLQEDIAKSTGIGWTDLVKDKLTVHFRSQSKLSQQELSDLQKATHFDKKELQQWYKGMVGYQSRQACTSDQALTILQAS